MANVTFRRIKGRIVPIKSGSDKSNAERAAKVGIGSAVTGAALAVKSDKLAYEIQKKIISLDSKNVRPFKSARSERLLNQAFRKKFPDAIKRAGSPLMRLTNETKNSFYSPWHHSILVKGRDYGAALHELGHAEAITKKAFSHKLPDKMGKPFFDLGYKLKAGSIQRTMAYKMADFSQDVGVLAAETDAWRRAFKSKVPMPIKKQMFKGAAFGIGAYATHPAIKVAKIGAIALGASLIYKGLKPKEKK
jgi:hypothetical protein